MADHDPKALLVWGQEFHRELERHLKATAAGQASPLTIPPETLWQFLALANAAIERVLKLDSTGGRPRNRPRGSGMGAHIEALIATGKTEDEAVAAVVKARGSTPEKARKALRWHRRPAGSAGPPRKAPKAPKRKASKKSPGSRRK
jgi:hypothetical protein